MGAQQSSTHTQSDSETRKTCYELLGVEQSASDLEIKKAYRKRALDLHPDRNLDNVDAATAKFAEIQSAYEILSDPQERAWYDSHRDAILNGQDQPGDDVQPSSFHNVRLTSTEDIIGLVRRFNSSVPFNDEPTGFFGITHETFEHLAREEDVAADFDGSELVEYPLFGSADDSYEPTVKSFYSVWAGFATRKSFSWKDKYRLSDAPDRRVRRLMEKENKKCRDDAIREFNDAVRFLVGFVRKRDPRYLPNTQTDAERQSSLRVAAAAQAARSRAANLQKMSTFTVPEWSKPEADVEPGDFFSDTDEQSDVEISECIVCNKQFKSDKQLEAHERSKKHIKAAQALRRQMKKEGKDLDIDATTPHVESRGDLSAEMEQDGVEVPNIDSTAHDSETLDEGGADKLGSASDNVISEASFEASDESGEYAARDIVEARLAGDIQSLTTDPTKYQPSNGGGLDANHGTTADNPEQRPKIGKAKIKRQKKAAANSQNPEHRCTFCGGSFSSRTKLFNHIRDENHEAPMRDKKIRR